MTAFLVFEVLGCRTPLPMPSRGGNEPAEISEKLVISVTLKWLYECSYCCSQLLWPRLLLLLLLLLHSLKVEPKSGLLVLTEGREPSCLPLVSTPTC